MKVAIDRLGLRHTLERIDYLFYGFGVFAALGLLAELFAGYLGLSFFFWAIMLGFSLRSFRQVLYNFQYSFWSFALFFSVYILLTMVGADDSFVVNCYLIALILLVILCAIMSSPLFYPRITWWEYDFRFRGELKIHAYLPGQKAPGRLTDLRREAGCIVLFEKLAPGTEFTIDYKNGDEINTYLVRVMLRRGPTLGRGYTYGVKFLFLQDKDHGRFQSLSNLWKVIKKAKRQAKFQNAS